MTLKGIKLTPKKNYHLKNKEGKIFEGCIYLGCYDSKNNYVEVSESEYQDYVKTLEEAYDKTEFN